MKVQLGGGLRTRAAVERAERPELLAEIRALVEAKGQGAKILRSGHPRTTLERLFLEATEE